MRRIVVGLAVVAAIAVAEVVAFTLLAQRIGIIWTLLLVMVTTPVGGWLLRREGVRGLRRLRAEVQAGRPPGRAAAEGALGLVAALLLVLPGLVTDLIGLALLIRPVRAFAASRARGLAERRMPPLLVGNLFGPRLVRTTRGAAGAGTPGGASRSGADPGGPPPTATPVIEGEIVDRTP